MPKLPVVSGKQCCKALAKLGFVKARQNGSHVVMRRGDSGCVVPMHREIKTGTLAGLLKQAHVTVDEFIGVL